MKAESITAAGALEALYGSGLLQGWAFDPNQPLAPALVYFFLDGRPLGVAEANVSREELPELGLDHGNVGFVFKLPPLALKHLRIGSILKLTLDADGQLDLKNTPIRIDERIFEILQQGMQQARLARLSGYLDGFVPTQGVYGWAWDPEYPGDAVMVYLFDEIGLIGKLLAKTFRPDVKQAGMGHGRYGFTANLNNAPGLARIKIGSKIKACFDPEGRRELHHSPLVITPNLYGPWEWKLLTRDLPAIWETFSLGEAIVTPAALASTLEVGISSHVSILGGVYSRNGTLDIRACLSRGSGKGHVICQYSPPRLDQAPTKYIPKTCIYGGVIIPEFGHFLTESLSRCQSFDEHPQMPIVFTCIDQDFDISDSKYAYIRDTFDLLGISSNRILIIREATRIKKLIVPKVGYRLWNYVVEKHTRFLAEKIAIHPKITGLAATSKKVYLSRSRLPKKANVQVPVIHGEDVFERYLGMEGFTIIHPQELTILEQISAIANAKFLVGFIGSAFHTLLLTHINPDHVIYLERKFNTPKKNQYKPIDQAKGIVSTYLDHAVETVSQFTLVDFQGVSKSLKKLGAVKNTYQQRPNLFKIQKQHDMIFNILKKSLFEISQEDIDVLSLTVKKLPNWARLLHHIPILRKLKSGQGS